MNSHSYMPSIPYYAATGNECALFDAAQEKTLPLAAEGTDRLRQDPLCRAYGGAVGAKAVYRGLP